MAENSVANAMEALRRRADLLVTGESSLGGVVVTHIKQLTVKVEKAVTMVSEAEKKAVNSLPIQVWLEKVNLAISQANDLLDECEYDIHGLNIGVQDKKQNKVRGLFLSYSWSNMSQEIKNTSLRIENILEEGIVTFSLMPSMVPTNGAAAAETIIQMNSSVIESSVVQEKYEVTTIVEQLLDEDNDKDLSFVTILGWVGIGKTTLARLVYKDVGVMYSFDERMWVRASVDFDINRIMKDMFKNLSGSRFERYGRGAIQRRLQEKLKGKKYLLVLDDIWIESITLWDSLMKFLLSLGGSRGSKVLLTTSVEEVSELVKPSYIRDLTMESDDYCWTLFEAIAFAEGGATKTAATVELGRAIVNEIRGNPLYIKLMGSLMYNIRDENGWLRIKESERWEDISHAVPQLCYDYMHSVALRQCFQYCSIFPKDYVTEREELIQLWMAQGFLSPPIGSDLDMEHVGARYHDILLGSSFLQVVEEDEFERKSCKMHELLHSFALSESKGSCLILENKVVKDNFEAVHLSMINCRVEFSKPLREVFSKLRTLYLQNIVCAAFLEDMLMSAKDLRVLIIVDWDLEELPSLIGKLKHLKYLDISRTGIVRLPDSIAKLYHLQTLRLYDLQDLPRNFENLVNLRYFRIENFKDTARMNLWPLKFRKLVNESTFKASYKAFLDNECQMEKLALWENPDRYSSLVIYRLENLRHEEAGKAKLSRMSRIESLKLHWSARRENCYDEEVLEGLQPHSNVKMLAIENFKGSKFPSWMVQPCSSGLHNLVKMELEDCIWCEQLPPLGHLRYLKILKIIGMNNVKHIGKEIYGFRKLNGGNSNYAPSDVFPALKEFALRGMASLVEWSGPELPTDSSFKVFPFLQKFEVEQCPMLSCIPEEISSRSCKHLQRLEIAQCNKLTHLPKGLGKLESLEDLEIRDLPSLTHMTIGCGNSLRSLIIGCFSSASEDNSDKSIHLKAGDGEFKSLPEQLKHLSSASEDNFDKSLHLKGGDGELKSLPEQLKHLSSASEDNSDKSLHLKGGDGELKSLPEQLKHLSSASENNSDTSLHLKGGDGELKSLPEQLKHLSGLRELTIWGYGGLEALPEWLPNLHCLQILKLEFCPKLKEFPAADKMLQLTNLEELHICYCPLLEEICTRGSHPEWYKISRIPIITVNYDKIKSQSSRKMV